jgi:hypothetical protein
MIHACLALYAISCQLCGACWFRNTSTGEMVHHWATGAKGKVNSERDLAGLVCNALGDDRCLNPERGYVGPDQDTWEKRRKFIDEFPFDRWND